MCLQGTEYVSAEPRRWDGRVGLLFLWKWTPAANARQLIWEVLRY